ncbi:MAG: protein phosphatase 2C domain-containing protein [Candidatus Binatia bacterium]|nr:protein phosphatase 2C domain-containing protein [Candidatus Binatia bacterium]
MQLECYARTETGRVRPTNQDAIGCFPDIGLFAVADGMGGHEAGEVASRMAVENLHSSFAGNPATEHGDRLAHAIAQSNEAIFAAGRPGGKTSSRPMGTTVVALSLSMAPRRANWAYVGDSRLYVCRKGELRLLTADHTRFGGKFSKSGEIPLDVAHTNELLAALGIESRVQLGSGSDSWRNDDVYLLCSDGISGLVTPEQIREGLSQSAPVDEIGARLVDQAIDAGGSDNASVVLVRPTM